MQLKSITLLAASLALVQAGTWADQPSISKPVEGGVSPPTGKPDGPSPPAGGPSKPVEGGEGPSPPTGKPSKPVEGGEGPSPPTGKPSKPVEGGEGPSPPTGKPDGPSKPVEGGEGPSPPTGKPEGPKGPTGGSTSVADETASHTWSDVSTIVDPTKTPVLGGETSSSTWADISSISTPVADTSSTSYPHYWGDETSVADTTKTPVSITSTSSEEHTWSDYDPSTSTPVSITSTFVHTWSDYVPTPEPSKPVEGGQGKPPGKPPGAPEQPVSGGNGKPPGAPEQPVSGGNGAPPAGGNGCGVVTVTVTNTATVTVQPGKPTAPPPPPPAPPVATSAEPEHTWADVSAAPVPTKPAGPPASGYMGIVDQYRGLLGLGDLEYDSKLESNALDCAASSGGALKHKLNPGSMAQVLAPGEPNDESFKKVFVGGWLCEIPKGPLDCGEMSKGWDYAGQTGHAEILTAAKYKKIGCACASGIWACDLA